MTSNLRGSLCGALLTLLTLLAFSATAADDAEIETVGKSESQLAKATQNPIADLISVPFQNNTSYNFGSRDRTQNVLNIQPVIPINLTENWNLVTRTILPIVSTPSGRNGQNRQNGIGDTSFTAFLSPNQPLGDWLVWGAGPVFNIPTASDDRLGDDLWGAGLSFVGLTMQGPVVAGAIISNVWNLDGDDYSRFLLQYFVNYNFAGGWYLSSSPIMTANWEADNNDWLIPIGGGFGKVHRFGKQPVNLSFQAFYNVEQNQAGADWSTRFQIQLLFPK